MIKGRISGNVDQQCYQSNIARSQSGTTMGSWRLTFLFLAVVVVLSEARSRNRDGSRRGQSRRGDHGGSSRSGVNHKKTGGSEGSDRAISRNDEAGNDHGEDKPKRKDQSEDDLGETNADGNRARNHHGEEEEAGGLSRKGQVETPEHGASGGESGRSNRRHRPRRRRRTSTTPPPPQPELPPNAI